MGVGGLVQTAEHSSAVHLQTAASQLAEVRRSAICRVVCDVLRYDDIAALDSAVAGSRVGLAVTQGGWVYTHSVDSSRKNKRQATLQRGRVVLTPLEGARRP